MLTPSSLGFLNKKFLIFSFSPYFVSSQATIFLVLLVFIHVQFVAQPFHPGPLKSRVTGVRPLHGIT